MDKAIIIIDVITLVLLTFGAIGSIRSLIAQKDTMSKAEKYCNIISLVLYVAVLIINIAGYIYYAK